MERNRRLAGAAVIFCAAQALLLAAGVLHTVADVRANVPTKEVISEVLVAIAALAAVPGWLLAARALSASSVGWRRLRLAILALAAPPALEAVREALNATVAFGDPYPTRFALQFVLLGCAQLALAIALALGAFLLDDAGGVRRNRVLAGVAVTAAAAFALEAAAYFILEGLYSEPAGLTAGLLLGGLGAAILVIAAAVAASGFVAAGRAEGTRLYRRESSLLAAGSLAVLGYVLVGAGYALQTSAVSGSSFGTIAATAIWADAGYAVVTAAAFAFAAAAAFSGRRSLASPPQQ